MPDMRKFWATVNKLAETLPNPCYITSIENEVTGAVGGRVCACEPRNAAQRITEGSHKQSTPEEIERHHIEMQQRNQVCASMEAAKQHKQSLVIDQKVAESLRLNK
jgi:hypothetical protein